MQAFARDATLPQSHLVHRVGFVLVAAIQQIIDQENAQPWQCQKAAPSTKSNAVNQSAFIRDSSAFSRVKVIETLRTLPSPASRWECRDRLLSNWLRSRCILGEPLSAYRFATASAGRSNLSFVHANRVLTALRCQWRNEDYSMVAASRHGWKCQPCVHKGQQTRRRADSIRWSPSMPCRSFGSVPQALRLNLDGRLAAMRRSG